MNPGMAEEGVKVVGGFVESMKAQPLSLALVVMNIALLALLYYVAVRSSELREKEFATVHEAQKEVQLLLSKCVVPDKP